MLRRYLIILTVSLLSIISCGFVIAATPRQEEAKYVASFNYTPDSQAAPGSAGVTFAIGDVSYVPSDVNELWIQELAWMKMVDHGKILWFAFPQFANLDKALRDDLSKLLMTKGFSIRGPFDSYDLIPYPDKKASDLYLIPKLELSFTVNDEKWPEANYNTGNIEVNGTMTLELREIVTRELMWAKNIPLTKFEFPYGIRCPSYFIDDKFNFIINDMNCAAMVNKFNLIMNEAAKGIEKQYPDIMATIAKLIDPEEMKIIKKQAQELKSKKGY